MKIQISEPDSPYAAALDPGVMDVTLVEVFNGVKFITKDGECLAVTMRDSGFEVHYFSEEDDEGKNFDFGWMSFKNANVSGQFT